MGHLLRLDVESHRCFWSSFYCRHSWFDGDLHDHFISDFSQWMLVDAYVLYNAFVVILGAIELRLWRYGVVCYLVRHHLYRSFKSDIFQVPAVIVLISAASRWSDFSTSSYCWLSNGNGVLWSFVGPVLAIIAAFMFQIFIIFRVTRSKMMQVLLFGSFPAFLKFRSPHRARGILEGSNSIRWCTSRPTIFDSSSLS